jgi:hypothetical protein
MLYDARRLRLSQRYFESLSAGRTGGQARRTAA